MPMFRIYKFIEAKDETEAWEEFCLTRPEIQDFNIEEAET